jgi:flagellar biogenesis protein FliO
MEPEDEFFAEDSSFEMIGTLIVVFLALLFFLGWVWEKLA